MRNASLRKFELGKFGFPRPRQVAPACAWLVALVVLFGAQALMAQTSAFHVGFNPIVPNPTNVLVGTTLNINISVTNNDIVSPNKIIFETVPLGGWPSNALLSTVGLTNAILSWTPSAAQVGTTNLTVGAYEFLAPNNSNTVIITVIVTNITPVTQNPVFTNFPGSITLDAGTNSTITISAMTTDNTTNQINFALDPSVSPVLATIVAVSNAPPFKTNGLWSATLTLTPSFDDALASQPIPIPIIASEANTDKAVTNTLQLTVTLAPDCPQFPSVVQAITAPGITNPLVLDECPFLVVTNTLIVTAQNAVLVGSDGLTNIITANNLTRLFIVESGASLTLEGLTLIGGRANVGGAIQVMEGGTLVVTNCIFQNNVAAGVDGLSGTAGRDDPNYGGPGGDALSGWPGLGGAICNAGRVFAYNCQFLTNQAAGGNGGTGGNGGSGTYQSGSGGKGGYGNLAYGGAIYNHASLVVSNCTFFGNSAVAGSGGNGGTASTNGISVFNGNTGNGGSGSIAAGGAICSGNLLTVQDSIFSDNAAVGGSSGAGGTSSGGIGVDGAPGGSGFGGAICMIGGGGSAEILSGCIFVTNAAVGGNGGDGGNGFYGGGNGGDGGSGFGGCLYNIGRVPISNCTFSGCLAIGGTNGVAGGGPFSGRNGIAGNLFNHFLTNQLNNRSNIFSGLTYGSPSLLGGPPGSNLPLINPATVPDPDASYAAASPSPSAPAQGDSAGGSSGAPGARNTNASPQGVSSSKGDPNAPAGVTLPALPAGGINDPNAPGIHPVPGSATNPPAAPAPAAAAPKSPLEEPLPAGMIDFRNAELTQVLDIYSMLVNRTLLHPATLPNPSIFLKTQGQLTVREGIQALEAVLALNGIAIVNVGDKFAKVVPEAQGGSLAGPFATNSAASLPDLGQYVTEVVQVTNVKPSEVIPVLQPFVKVPNGILPVDTSGILVLRDYAENVKRMLELIAKLDVAYPSEFEQEVIPIKYAKASEIASALNSLSAGGGGGASVGSSGGGSTTGSRSSSRTGTGSRSGGLGGYGTPGSSPFGTQGGVAGQGAVTPGAQGGSSFTQRLQNIINKASSTTGDIQVIGQTKIISDERTNSLLIFASKADMKKIKEIISKLDVVLAQVLIETVIIEVTLTDSHDLGFSYLQHPQNVGNWTGVGAVNNKTFQSPGNYILNQNGVTNGSSGAIPGGFTYLMSFGQDLDVAVAAVQGNSRARILQRPRIQTSHNEPASIFVGESRPYPTSSYYGGGAYGGYSSIQQLEIGVSLDVTPLINPDGLVVMDIHQKIDAFEGNVTIQNVGDVPITSEKEAQAKVSVRDHDTIILGGLIETDKNNSKSGVPFLMDLPMLGYLFRSTHSDETRKELIVLIRPTVLPTPEIAALAATAEKNKMSGVRGTETDLRREETLRLQKANEDDQRKQPITVTPP